MRVALGAAVLTLGLAVGEHASSRAANPAPIGHYLVGLRGVRVYFENLGQPYSWNSGELVRRLAADEGIQQEVGVQLDHMRGLGINEIAFELRSVGDVQDNQPPPDCRLGSGLGAHWPDPLPNEVTGLRTLLDLIRARGMRLVLHLTNTHHEAPFAMQERWLGPLLSAVKGDPALDYVTFDGDVSLLVTGQCGGQSEAALWTGPTASTARFVAAAIRYGIALGMPPNTLTAETIVPFPYSPWKPVAVMKGIFDQLGIPPGERTYALSHYERGSTPHQTADDALARAYEQIGKTPGDRDGPRVVLSEFGDAPDRNWTAGNAVESFGVLMQRYGIDGGNFWLWAQMNDPDESRTDLPGSMKRRGVEFRYYAVAKQIRDLYGFHIDSIRGGSFESGWRAAWQIAGKGAARGVPFEDEARLPWRGKTTLRLEGRPTIAATSGRLRVSGDTTYTTTGDFRAARRGSSVTFRYLTCGGGPSAERRQTRFPLSKSTRFATFVFRYTTPSDACSVRIRIVAVRGRLFADNLR
jgi:hypothetical protein